MRNRSTVLSLSFILTIAAAVQGATAFWMGNSFSMGLPELLSGMWSHATPAFSLNVTEEFYAGTSLQKHWDMYHCNDSIAGSHFTNVIMQTYYWATFDRSVFAASDSVYASRITALARANGAEPILDVTHLGYAASVQNWQAMCGANDSLAKKLNIRVIPRAWAWRRALDQWPHLFLWTPRDSVHQGTYGEMLNAYVYYGFFTGQSPIGHPFTNGISADTALFLQTVAWEAVQEGHGAVRVANEEHALRRAVSQRSAVNHAYLARIADPTVMQRCFQLNGVSLSNNASRSLPEAVLVDARPKAN
jgi:hypothetical protein